MEINKLFAILFVSTILSTSAHAMDEYGRANNGRKVYRMLTVGTVALCGSLAAAQLTEPGSHAQLVAIAIAAGSLAFGYVGAVIKGLNPEVPIGPLAGLALDIAGVMYVGMRGSKVLGVE